LFVNYLGSILRCDAMYGGRYVLTLQRLLVEVAATAEKSVLIYIINILYHTYNISISNRRHSCQFCELN